jgi:hypothetical protein
MAAIWQWEHFHRHEGLQPYQDSHLRYATCKFCTAEPTITHADEIKAELEKDRSKRRARALGAGFILGRAREMSRHLKTCKTTRPEHREHATRDLSTATKKSSEAIRVQPDSSEQSRIPLLTASTKRKRSETSVAEDIRMFSVGGKRHRYDPELHSQLITQAAAFNFLSGSLFRALHDFYCGCSKFVERSGLVICPRKIREKFSSRAYDAALVDLETQLSSLALSKSRSYTIADDGFTTVAKNHVDGVTIGRPDSRSLTIGIIPVTPSELHEVAIAKGWDGI